MPLFDRAMRPLLPVGIVLVTGCVSISTTQTAQTLQPGETQRTWGAGYYHYDPSTLSGADEEEIEAPYVETILGGTLGARIGERRGLYVEFSYQADVRSAFEALQVNVAWFTIR